MIEVLIFVGSSQIRNIQIMVAVAIQLQFNMGTSGTGRFEAPGVEDVTLVRAGGYRLEKFLVANPLFKVYISIGICQSLG